MLHAATEKSLCLIDEFGKGTTPCDGIALLAVTIKALIAKKAKALFALHFTEILGNGILLESEMKFVSSFRMDFLHTKSSNERNLFQSCLEEQTSSLIEEIDQVVTVTPLFKLKLGVSASSEGIACARNSGLPEDVLSRANNIKECITQRTPIQRLSSVSRDKSKFANLLSDLPQGLGESRYRELLRIFLKTNLNGSRDLIASAETLQRLKQKLW